MKTAPKGKILIVEDDDGIATLQSNRLKRFGHTIVRAASAEEATVYMENGDLDLLVLDYGLTGDVTGIDLFSIFRERGYTTPAILVTGFEDPKIIIQAMRLGVRDFIPKSIEFLDDLPLTVERVMRQVAAEREAADSIAIKEKQEQLEAASFAARLSFWSWDLGDGAISWSGPIDQMLGIADAANGPHRGAEGFLSLVAEEDRANLENALAAAKKSQEVFEKEFRIRRPSGEQRWVFFRGRAIAERSGAPRKMAGILIDVTDRKLSEAKLATSYEQIQALNDRLQLSVTETHHRIKNQLQSIISLVSLSLRERSVIDADGAKKIIAHVQGLAALHDVLVEQSREEGDTRTIPVHQVFEKLITVFQRSVGVRQVQVDLEPCHVTAKQGASLTVILNELLSNALKHGAKNTAVVLSSDGERGELKVTSEGTAFPENFNPSRTGRTGLLLLTLLAKSDLETEPLFENLEGSAVVTVSFPVSQPARRNA